MLGLVAKMHAALGTTGVQARASNACHTAEYGNIAALLSTKSRFFMPSFGVLDGLHTVPATGVWL